jgi:hypothetical protein
MRRSTQDRCDSTCRNSGRTRIYVGRVLFLRAKKKHHLLSRAQSRHLMFDISWFCIVLFSPRSA